MRYFVLTPVASLVLFLLLLLMVQLAGLKSPEPVKLQLHDEAAFDLTDISFTEPSEPVPETVSEDADQPQEMDLDSLIAEQVEFDEALPLTPELEMPALIPLDEMAPLPQEPLLDELLDIELPDNVLDSIAVKPKPKVAPKVVKKKARKVPVKKVAPKKIINKVTAKPVPTPPAKKVKKSQALPKNSAVQGVKTSTPLRKVKPKYPNRARRRGIEGEVSVSFIVSENGSVKRDSIRIISAKPAKVFNRSVVTAVAKWKFSKSARSYRTSQRLVFTLKK